MEGTSSHRWLENYEIGANEMIRYIHRFEFKYIFN